MKTIIEEIKKSSYEYKIGENEQVTLILLARNTSAEVHVYLTGKGANVNILGFICGETPLTLKTFQHHQAPETTSNLLVKSILKGKSKFFYEGVIRVEKNAQKTDAYQRNENLLLSPAAHAESKPRLEILANDVRCTHGATTGTISKDQLWYLQSRGISEKKARELLVRGFLESALSRVSDTIQHKVRRYLWQIV